MFGKGCVVLRFRERSNFLRAYAQFDRVCTPRPDSFYEEENVKRNYYYVMDLRGQLFVENVVRNIATSMKDAKFLDFMFKNLQQNTTGINPEIPFVTYCGKEKNFVSPIDSNSAFVFKDIIAPKVSGIPYQLQYGGTLSQNFDPSLLAFSPETGRMYHQIKEHRHLSSTSECMVYGLLNVNITTQYFSDNFIFDTAEASDKDEGGENEKMFLQWESTSEPGVLLKYPIHILK